LGVGLRRGPFREAPPFGLKLLETDDGTVELVLDRAEVAKEAVEAAARTGVLVEDLAGVDMDGVRFLGTDALEAPERGADFVAQLEFELGRGLVLEAERVDELLEVGLAFAG
jgi:hypothetical protein